jgi:MYXO-CTERM domain-containing protein
MRRPARHGLFALALIATLGAPCIASANLTAISVGSFGTHMSVMPDLVMYPIGLNECLDTSVTIPITFTLTNVGTGTTVHYVDVWTANSPTVTCATGGIMGRGNTTTNICNHVSLPSDVNSFYGGTTFTMRVEPSQLFSGCSTTNTLTFFFFDVTSIGDNSTTFAAGSYQTLTITLNTTPPQTPTVNGPLAGDYTVEIPWSVDNISSLGIAGRVNVYVVGTGCTPVWPYADGAIPDASTDAFGTDVGLDMNVVGPDMGAVETGVSMDAGVDSGLDAGTDAAVYLSDAGTSIMQFPASSPIEFPTTLLGWQHGTYNNETVLLSVATVDTSGNTSAPSPAVCVQHVQAIGFWDRYCAAHGFANEAGAATPQCAQHFNGCACSIAGGQGDDRLLIVFGMIAGAFVFRRRRR